MPSGIYQHKKGGHWKISESGKENIRKSHKGLKYKSMSFEGRENLRKAHLGHKHSEETRRKMSEAHKGEKGSGWKGGINPINDTIRKNIEFRLWREAVFARDAWICQKCGVRGGILNPHHILNFSDHIELRFAIDNGITLCKNCHKEFHHIYGKKNNNYEQVKEFVAKILEKLK